jgi:diguanylate cyclase
MLKVIGCITQQHDIRLVGAAGLICFLACFTSINMLWRSYAHKSIAGAAWLAGAALVFGTGVWTTHFVAMLAFESHLLIGYDAVETATSLLVDCVGAWVAFWIYLRSQGRPVHSVVAGMILGGSVGLMHFMGMDAMRFHGVASLDRSYVIAAILVGLSLASPALIVAGQLEKSSRRVGGAALLVLAIVGLHFTGMTALSVEAMDVPVASGLVFGTSLLTFVVVGTAGMILILSLLCTFMDQYLTRRTIREQGSLRHMAHHDGLTGLPNRLAFANALDGIMKDAERQSAECAVLCFDLDRFKLVNDLFGHQVGDGVLTAVAARLRSLTRPVDAVARISGDEFVVAMAPSTNPDAAGLMAARLVTALAEPMMVAGLQVCIGVSIGISMYPSDSQDAGNLMRNADMALYQAKRDGRGTHRFFEPKMNERLRGRQHLEMELRRAIEVGEFELYYQPLVDTRGQRIIGYEALIRWNHPERGLVPPVDFIPIAEESGLIVNLGRWVLETACREAALWPDDFQVSVNVSPLQVQKPDLVDTVAEILSRSGLSPHRLELEMTESVLIHHPEQALETLNRLRDLGVRLSLDDFGTGYSSLSYLRRFPFNKIKIDQSFIQTLGEDSESGVLARSIVALGHGLGLQVTAEGVETVEQYQFLAKEACNQVQGYFFGRPEPARKLTHANRKMDEDLVAADDAAILDDAVCGNDKKSSGASAVLLHRIHDPA